jgi:hypothetical protein
MAGLSRTQRCDLEAERIGGADARDAAFHGSEVGLREDAERSAGLRRHEDFEFDGREDVDREIGGREDADEDAGRATGGRADADEDVDREIGGLVDGDLSDKLRVAGDREVVGGDAVGGRSVGSSVTDRTGRGRASRDREAEVRSVSARPAGGRESCGRDDDDRAADSEAGTEDAGTEDSCCWSNTFSNSFRQKGHASSLTLQSSQIHESLSGRLQQRSLYAVLFSSKQMLHSPPTCSTATAITCFAVSS